MSEYKLALELRTIAGKKLSALRASGLIPSVIYGGKEPILTSSVYNDTEKVLRLAGYHSPIDLMIDGKKKLAIVKTVSLDPVSKRILNIEFQAVSAREAIEATTPIVLADFESSEAYINLHLALNQVIDEIDVKAKPAALPKELTIDASKVTSLDDKFTLADITLPEGVEFADKELDLTQITATVHDPAAEAAAREAKEAAEAAAAAETNAEEESAEESAEEPAEETSAEPSAEPETPAE